MVFEFVKKLKEEPTVKTEELDEKIKVIREVEDDLRDLINWIEIKNKEEVEGGTKQIEDETAAELKEKIRKIAVKLGVGTL